MGDDNGSMRERKKVAAVISQWFRGSHADVIIPKFIFGFPTDEGLLPPRVELVSVYLDQVPEADVGLERGDRGHHRVASDHPVLRGPARR